MILEAAIVAPIRAEAAAVATEKKIDRLVCLVLECVYVSKDHKRTRLFQRRTLLP